MPAYNMEAYILNQQLETLAVVDGYKSFIWTERFKTYGEFEIGIRPDASFIQHLVYPNYLWLRGSERLMCIDDYELSQEWEEGDIVTVKGRTLESILETRRVFYPLSFNDVATSQCLTDVMNQNVLNPTLTERKYSYIQMSSAMPASAQSHKYTGDFFGETVYEAIESLCDTSDTGMKMIANNATNMFVLSFYDGVDRSYSQSVLPPVVFSTKYENLAGAKYYRNPLTKANAAVIHGSDLTKTETVTNPDGSTTTNSTQIPMYAFTSTDNSRDRNRVEISVESTGLSTQKDDETYYTEEEYKAMLVNAGKAQIGRHKITETFTGDIDATRQFVYGEDFNLGDIVQVVDNYGHSGRMRVSEIIISEDYDGFLVTPTFVALT